MSLTLVPDLGLEISNSYCSLQYASDYWASDYRSGLSAKWAALTSDQQTKALIAACYSIERLRFVIPQALPAYALHYDRRTRKVLSLNLTRQPVKFYYYQRLQFPRNLDVYYLNLPGDVTPPANWAIGNLYIPEPILIAQCEQAMYLLDFDESDLAAQLQGVSLSTISLGKGEIEVTKQFTGSGRGVNLSPTAIGYLSEFVVKNGALLRA